MAKSDGADRLQGLTAPNYKESALPLDLSSNGRRAINEVELSGSQSKAIY